MGFLNDNVLDNGLAWLVSNGTVVDICVSEPATYANVASFTLGSKAGITVGNPEAKDGGGRKVAVPAISDGSVTGTGEATCWAITNGADALIAAGALSSPQNVTSGNTFTLTTFDVGIPGVA